MRQCKECGATLPENARYCLQCGTETTDAVRAENAGAGPDLDFLKPSLAGGAAMGVLSSLPLISVLCCLWVPLGGALTSFLLNKQRPGRITLGDGAFGGVIAGLIGAILNTIFSIPIRMMNREALEQARRQMDEMMQRAGNEMPAGLRNFMDMMLSPDITVTSVLFGFVFAAIAFGLFAMVGGIVGAALLRKDRQY
jgi:hypothetical protein